MGRSGATLGLVWDRSGASDFSSDRTTLRPRDAVPAGVDSRASDAPRSPASLMLLPIPRRRSGAHRAKLAIPRARARIGRGNRAGYCGIADCPEVVSFVAVRNLVVPRTTRFASVQIETFGSAAISGIFLRPTIGETRAHFGRSARKKSNCHLRNDVSTLGRQKSAAKSAAIRQKILQRCLRQANLCESARDFV